MRNATIAVEILKEAESELKKSLIGKDLEVEYLLSCMAAQTPILLIGEPGTGKSLLVKEFTTLLGMDTEGVGSDYFHYLLTKFTEPSEIFGPLDINKLMGEGKEISYSRIVRGKLPEARIAFLDEIFKANSAILNTLLTLVNEKRFYNDGVWHNAPLKMLVAASNEMPQDEELKAFIDRIPIRIYTEYLNFEESGNLEKLLQSAIKTTSGKTKNLLEKHKISIDDFFSGIQELQGILHEKINIFLRDQEKKDFFIGKVTAIRNHDEVSSNISDRQILSLLKVMAAKRIIAKGLVGEITKDSIRDVLKMTWNNIESRKELERLIDNDIDQ